MFADPDLRLLCWPTGLVSLFGKLQTMHVYMKQEVGLRRLYP